MLKSKSLILIAGLVLSLFLTACNSLSREECLYASWYKLGIQDGRAGKTLKVLGRHRHACIEYGVTVDESEYLRGREQGLVDYCQISNAFETGLRGDRYQGVCPVEIDAVFNRYNNVAYQVYQKRAALKSLDKRLSSKERSLLDKELSDEKKSHINTEITQLQRDHQQLLDEFYDAERQLDQLMDESRQYRLQ